MDLYKQIHMYFSFGKSDFLVYFLGSLFTKKLLWNSDLPKLLPLIYTCTAKRYLKFFLVEFENYWMFFMNPFSLSPVELDIFSAWNISSLVEETTTAKSANKFVSISLISTSIPLLPTTLYYTILSEKEKPEVISSTYYFFHIQCQKDLFTNLNLPYQNSKTFLTCNVKNNSIKDL